MSCVYAVCVCIEVGGVGDGGGQSRESTHIEIFLFSYCVSIDPRNEEEEVKLCVRRVFAAFCGFLGIWVG